MSHHNHPNLILHKMPTSLCINILLCNVAWNIQCPHMVPFFFFFWLFQDFSETQQQQNMFGFGFFFFCSSHKYPLCMAPDVMKWWMWSSLAFPKSRSRFLLQSDPKQIMEMSWALLLSLTQLLLELLISFIILSPISKTGGVSKWQATLRKARRKANPGLFNAQIPITASAICLFPEQKAPGNFCVENKRLKNNTGSLLAVI